MDARNRLAKQQKDSLYKDFVKIISQYVKVTDGPKGQQKKIWKLKNPQGGTEVWIDGGKQYHFHLDEKSTLRFDMNPSGTICGIYLTIKDRGEVVFNNGEPVNSVMVDLASAKGDFTGTPGEDLVKAVKEEQKKMQGEEEDKKEEETNDDDESKKTNKKKKRKKKKKQNDAEVKRAQQHWLRLGNGLQVLELRKEGSRRTEIIDGLKKQKAQKDIKNLVNNLANKMRNNKFSQLKSGLNDNQLLGGYYGCMFKKQSKTYQLEKDRMKQQYKSQMEKVQQENNKLKNTVAQLKNEKDALMMNNNLLKGKQTEIKGKLAEKNKQLDIAKSNNINLQKTDNSIL